MLIHAHVRKEATPVDTGNAIIQFELTDSGHVVADVTDEDDIGVLLAIPEAFKLYKPEAAVKKAVVKAPSTPAPAPAADAAEKPYLLKGETPEQDMDLGAMDEVALTEFAKANSVNIHHSWRGDVEKIRQKLFERFSA
ncbi:MAG: hypothetical protein ACK5A0_15360 [Polaromonas sp.]